MAWRLLLLSLLLLVAPHLPVAQEAVEGEGGAGPVEQLDGGVGVGDGGRREDWEKGPGPAASSHQRVPRSVAGAPRGHSQAEGEG